MHTAIETSKPMLFPAGGFLTLQQGGPAWPSPEPVISGDAPGYIPETHFGAFLQLTCRPASSFSYLHERMEKAKASEVLHFIILDQYLLRLYDLIVSASCLHPKTGCGLHLRLGRLA